jgi:TetR/AcrR family fatty acid metabolism transcriptional regulator
MSRKPDIARRREIAARAFEAIRERGVHRTSMSDLAAALEMKRPTLYWYFKDLDEIFAAVINRADERWGAFIAARLAGVTDPIDYLEAFLEASAEFYHGQRDHVIALFQLWAASAAEKPERILERSRDYIEPMRAGLIDRLNRGIAAGLVVDCDAEGVVDVVLSIADGVQVQRVTRDADLEPIVATVIRYVLTPLRAHSQPEKKARRR